MSLNLKKKQKQNTFFLSLIKFPRFCTPSFVHFFLIIDLKKQNKKNIISFF